MDPMGNHFTHLVESCRIYTPCNREKILHDISTWLTSSMCVFFVLPWKKYKDQNHQTCLIIDIHMFRWNPQEFLPSSPSSRFVTGGGFFEARQRRRWTFGLFFLLLLVLFGLFCHLSEKHETTRRRVVRETICHPIWWEVEKDSKVVGKSWTQKVCMCYGICFIVPWR